MTGEAIERCIDVADGEGMDVQEARAELRALMDAAHVIRIITSHPDKYVSWSQREPSGTIREVRVPGKIIASFMIVNGLPALTPEACTALGEPC